MILDLASCILSLLGKLMYFANSSDAEAAVGIPGTSPGNRNLTQTPRPPSGSSRLKERVDRPTGCGASVAWRPRRAWLDGALLGPRLEIRTQVNERNSRTLEQRRFEEL